MYYSNNNNKKNFLRHTHSREDNELTKKFLFPKRKYIKKKHDTVSLVGQDMLDLDTNSKSSTFEGIYTKLLMSKQVKNF